MDIQYSVIFSLLQCSGPIQWTGPSSMQLLYYFMFPIMTETISSLISYWYLPVPLPHHHNRGCREGGAGRAIALPYHFYCWGLVYQRVHNVYVSPAGFQHQNLLNHTAAGTKHRSQVRGHCFGLFQYW